MKRALLMLFCLIIGSAFADNLSDEAQANKYLNPVICSVLGHDGSDCPATLTIDSGENSMLAPGMPVVVGGAMVGYIEDVSAESATVRTIISSRASVTVTMYEWGGEVSATLEGMSEREGKPLCRLWEPPEGVSATAGNLVLTQRVEGSPIVAGIPIGYVLDSESLTEGGRPYRTVEPLTDFRSLHSVIVLRAPLYTGPSESVVFMPSAPSGQAEDVPQFEGGAASGDCQPESLEALLAFDWMPQHETIVQTETYAYTSVTLLDADGAPVAFLRIDRDSHRVIYFRRADFELPAWPTPVESSETGLTDREKAIWRTSTRACADFADAVVLSFSGKHPSGDSWQHSGDPNCAMRVQTFGGFLRSALFLSLPTAEDQNPRLLAYVDVNTNAASGYDGYLTGEQAASVALEAVRRAYGDDAADHAQPEEGMSLCIDVLWAMSEITDAETARAYQEGGSLLWVVTLIDPRGDIDSEAYEAGFEERYLYNVIMDAKSGEVLSVLVEHFAYG